MPVFAATVFSPRRKEFVPPLVLLDVAPIAWSLVAAAVEGAHHVALVPLRHLLHDRA
jgi:hypothetical protein